MGNFANTICDYAGVSNLRYTNCMDVLIQLISIFVLGFIAGAIPGAILTSIFTEVLREGFVKSLRVIFYAGISEVIVATGIMFVLFSIHIPHAVYYAISFIGAVVLIWLATKIWAIKKLHEKGNLFDFKKIFLLSISNGPLWIFWTTICVPQAYVLSQKITGGQVLFLAIFELGWTVSTLLLTFLFSQFRPLLTREKVVSKVFKVFAVFLILFSVRLALTSIFFFLK